MFLQFLIKCTNKLNIYVPNSELYFYPSISTFGLHMCNSWWWLEEAENIMKLPVQLRIYSSHCSSETGTHWTNVVRMLAYGLRGKKKKLMTLSNKIQKQSPFTQQFYF
jgi:hypothetical protein